MAENAISPRRARQGMLRRSRGDQRRSFASTLRALEDLAGEDAQVSVHVRDLDSEQIVLVGDDHRVLPVAGLGVVPLLIEVAAQLDVGRLDAHELLDRAALAAVDGGLWSHLHQPSLPVGDAAILAAAGGDALAANALLQRVGLDAVRARLEGLGMHRLALLDRFRDRRGPDDAPQLALGSARELAVLFAALVSSGVVSPAVSAQVAEWLSLGQDLSLVASVTGLDPFSHTNDSTGLLFVNKTGRAPGVRAEAGVLGGPRAGVAYALIVCFDERSILHRLRVHEAFHTLGLDLMEYVF